MRERSYSRFVIEESERILVAMGAECKINNPSGLPLPNIGAIQPTQGKTFAVMQVNGGTQIFNVVNQLGVLGRWMGMNTISNQSSAPKVFQEFDENGRMKPSGYYNRIVDVLEG